MSILVIIVIIALFILTIETYPTHDDSVSKKRPTKWKATVVHIIDGDTLEIDFHGKRERVRLLLVDTPELNKQNPKKSQPFAEKAKAFLQEQLAGQTLFFEQDEEEKDAYGRLLLYAFKGDQLVQELLLRKGYARMAPFSPNLKYYERLKTVEEKAKRQKVGIWSLPGYVTANGFAHSLQTDADLERKQPIKTNEDKDCTDFGTQKEAQAYFEAKGGSSSYNADHLDGSDQDGIVCESLP